MYLENQMFESQKSEGNGMHRVQIWKLVIYQISTEINGK